MERSFAKDVKQLRLGAGDTFRGEGILAITKALLQSGLSYVGGYQGAPVSHVMDVLTDARDLLDEMGIHYEACANEAATLCPSFYRADMVRNPNAFDRALYRFRRFVIGLLQGRAVA